MRFLILCGPIKKFSHETSYYTKRVKQTRATHLLQSHKRVLKAGTMLLKGEMRLFEPARSAPLTEFEFPASCDQGAQF